MTRRSGARPVRNGTADRVARRSRQLESEGRIAPRHLPSPARAFKLTPGFAVVYVKTRAPDGTPRDADEALRFLADRSYAHLLVYRGTSRQIYHCFEYDPRELV